MAAGKGRGLNLRNRPDKEAKAAAGERPLMPTDATYASVAPAHIRANPHNPRMFFDDETIEQLADSIKQKGILVPLTVYEDKTGQSTHVLLDGERRWRAAKLINMPSVPAWVIPKPSGVENTLRMFNIHMLREEWDELAIAWAFEELMKELKTDSVEELRKATGLSSDRIRNIKILLAFPKAEQRRVADGKLSFNYLIELEKNILRKLRKADDDVMGAKEKEVRSAFIKKYLTDVDTDPIALRQVGKLIDTARLEGSVGTRAKSALQRLMSDPQMTVEEAYEMGAAASVELRRVMRDMEELPGRVDVVLQSQIDATEMRDFRSALRRLSKSIATLIERDKA